MEMIETFRSGHLFTFLEYEKKNESFATATAAAAVCINIHEWNVFKSTAVCDRLNRAMCLHVQYIHIVLIPSGVLPTCWMFAANEWILFRMYSRIALSLFPSLSRCVWNTFDAVRILTNQCVDCVFYVWYSSASSFIPSNIDWLPVYTLFRIWLQWQKQFIYTQFRWQLIGRIFMPRFVLYFYNNKLDPIFRILFE